MFGNVIDPEFDEDEPELVFVVPVLMSIDPVFVDHDVVGSILIVPEAVEPVETAHVEFDTISILPVEAVPVFVVPVMVSPVLVLDPQFSSTGDRYMTTLSCCVPLYVSVSMIEPVVLVRVIVSIPVLLRDILVSEYEKVRLLCTHMLVPLGIV